MPFQVHNQSQQPNLLFAEIVEGGLTNRKISIIFPLVSCSSCASNNSSCSSNSTACFSALKQLVNFISKWILHAAEFYIS